MKNQILNSKINTVKKELKLYENNTCPTCTAPLNSDFHLDIKKEKEEKLDSLCLLNGINIKGRC